jgi:pSer/pThr/pTyr-binding forkhead associated (FHA) protein
MDDHARAVEDGHPLQGPHWGRPDDSAPPTDFVPLRLVLKPGGQSVDVARPDVLIGRHTDADVRLPLPDVSRRHCRCVFKEGTWQVVDLNSLNGIYVNGEKVQKANLNHRDTFTIGGFTFEVQLGAGEGTVQFPQAPTGTEEDVIQSIVNALPNDEAPGRRLAG